MIGGNTILKQTKETYYVITRRQIYWIVFLGIITPMILLSTSYKEHVQSCYHYITGEKAIEQLKLKKTKNKKELRKEGLTIIQGWSKEKYDEIKVEKSDSYNVEPIEKGTDFADVIKIVGMPMTLQPGDENYREVFYAGWESPFSDGDGIRVNITYDKTTNRVLAKEIDMD